jgi:hypothetical protein
MGELPWEGWQYGNRGEVLNALYGNTLGLRTLKILNFCTLPVDCRGTSNNKGNKDDYVSEPAIQVTLRNSTAV